MGDNEYGRSKSQDKRLEAQGNPRPTERQMVTAEMLRLAMDEAWDFDCYQRETLLKVLNAALRPVIEGEIARARLYEHFSVEGGECQAPDCEEVEGHSSREG